MNLHQLNQQRQKIQSRPPLPPNPNVSSIRNNGTNESHRGRDPNGPRSQSGVLLNHEDIILFEKQRRGVNRSQQRQDLESNHSQGLPAQNRHSSLGVNSNRAISDHQSSRGGQTYMTNRGGENNYLLNSSHRGLRGTPVGYGPALSIHGPAGPQSTSRILTPSQTSSQRRAGGGILQNSQREDLEAGEGGSSHNQSSLYAFQRGEGNVPSLERRRKQNARGSQDGIRRVRFEDSQDEQQTSQMGRTLQAYGVPRDIISPVNTEAATTKNQVPKVISLYELYKVFIELSVAACSCIIFIFLHIIFSSQNSDITMFLDLSLVPWLIWITKKIVDTVRSYKTRINDCDDKYEVKLKEIQEKERVIQLNRQDDSTQPAMINPADYSSVDNSQNMDENHSLIIQARNARLARLRAQQNGGYLSREEMAITRNGMMVNHQYHMQMQQVQRERNRVLNAKNMSQQKHRCQHGKYMLEILFLIVFIVVLELRLRFFQVDTTNPGDGQFFFLQKSQVLFYVLLGGFVLRFLFYRVIKKDFNAVHSFVRNQNYQLINQIKSFRPGGGGQGGGADTLASSRPRRKRPLQTDRQQMC